MRCPICSEEVGDARQARRWGPEFAHARCVTAFNVGKEDERERCAALADEYATWGGSNFYEWFKKLAAAIRA